MPVAFHDGRNGSKPPCRQAFTLVELLVVIAIIGVLVAVLLPAVQMAREAARRLQCANNLKQLSLAVTNYEVALGILPAAGIVDIDDGEFQCRSGKMFSWIVLVLPYMEQEMLQKQFDFEVSVLQQSGDPQAERPRLLVCPSDSARRRMFVDPDLTAGRSFAKGNYAAYCSTYHVDYQESPSLGFPGAIVGHGLKLARITDGVSRTLMLSEVRTRDNEHDQRGVWALPWAGASLLSVDRHSRYSSYYEPDGYTAGQAQTPNTQGPNLDVLYNCDDPVDAQWKRMPCKSYPAAGYISAAPRSVHPGGVNGAFVDGHVQFLLNEIPDRVLAYLVCIEDNRIADPDSLAP